MFKALFITGTLLACASLSTAQETYTTWAYHKTVVLNTSPTGANVTGNVLRFPVLVRLAAQDSLVFKQSAPTGADLRFTKPDGTTRLSHQIESWDSAGRAAVVWVLVDSVLGGRKDRYIRMHWGKAGAADSSKGAAVFDTANGFQAVWHMNGTASANEADATANNFTATQNNAPASVAGAVGRGRNFEGTQYFTAENSASGPLNFAYNADYMISAWVNATTLASHGVVVSKHDMQYALKLNNGGASWQFIEFTSGVGWASALAPAEAQVWKHLVGFQHGPTGYIYVDGELVAESIAGSASTGSRVETNNVTIGRQEESANRYFNGVIDELRMSNRVRSADWIKLEFENQKAAQTLVRLTDSIPTSLGRGTPRPEVSFSARATPRGLAFEIRDANAARVLFSLTDMRGRLVWKRATAVDGGAASLAWDGSGRDGQASAGLYAVHAALTAADGKVLQSLDRMISFAR